MQNTDVYILRGLKPGNFNKKRKKRGDSVKNLRIFEGYFGVAINS